MTHFFLNDEKVEIDQLPDFLVLDYLRRIRRLTAVKEGCREGDCGACMVLLGEKKEGKVGYHAVNSCLLAMGHLPGRHLITLEGLNGIGLNPIQQALVEEGGIQCGFCTPGMVLSLTGFFMDSPVLEEQEALERLAGNICRCTGYVGIRRAVQRLCRGFKGDEFAQTRGDCLARMRLLVRYGILPEKLATAIEAFVSSPEPAPPEEPKGEKAGRRIAGGTDLLIEREKRASRESLHFLSDCGPRRGIQCQKDQWAIGSRTTIEEFRTDPEAQRLFPQVKEWFSWFASDPIRRQATVGGNLLNASPIGDFAILALAWNASLYLDGPNGQRNLPLQDLYLGYKQLAMGPRELLVEVQIPHPAPGYRCNFEKVCRRKYLDIASVNSAILLQEKEMLLCGVRISAGGVAPIPLLLRGTGQFLEGKPVTAAVIGDATTIAQEEISPIDDVRGSARYKRELLSRLILAHFHTLFPEAGLL